MVEGLVVMRERREIFRRFMIFLVLVVGERGRI